jgi:hypothetical protein
MSCSCHQIRLCHQCQHHAGCPEQRTMKMSHLHATISIYAINAITMHAQHCCPQQHIIFRSPNQSITTPSSYVLPTESSISYLCHQVKPCHQRHHHGCCREQQIIFRSPNQAIATPLITCAAQNSITNMCGPRTSRLTTIKADKHNNIHCQLSNAA